MEFKPKIIGLCCNWCAYAGADLAGVSRVQYPPSVRVVRVMCSSRVDPIIIIEAFTQGVDGALVVGCHPGDCHYQRGNYQTERNIRMTKKLIKYAGIEPERLRLEWVSAAEGGRFAETVRDFTNQIRSLGPSPLAGKEPDINKLKDMLAAKDAAAGPRLRALIGKEREIIEEGNVYGEKISQEEFDRLMDEAIESEVTFRKILQIIKENPLSVKEISKSIDLPPENVLQDILEMKRMGLVALDKIEGTSPLYIALEGA